jgi:RNA polymerase sigma-70 factor (ECF subfamily)
MAADPAHELDDALACARAGDPRGFDALFRSTGPAVAGFLRARNVGDPDGLANEVFLKVFHNIDTFKGNGAQFRSWLFTVTRNVAIDDARRRRRRPAPEPLEHAAERRGGDVEDDVIARLADERVRAMLERLSPDQREVLLLRIVADLTLEDTAAVVEKSVEAVKALQRRGLAALRRALSAEKGVPR